MKKSGAGVMVLASMALLWLSACKPSAPAIHVTAAPSALPNGWAEVASRDGATRVGIPGGWRAGVDKATDSLMGLAGSAASSEQPNMDALNNDNPGLAQMAADTKRQSDADEQRQLAEMEKRGIIVNVINGSRPVPGEARTHYFVRRDHHDGNMTWNEARDIEKGRLGFQPVPTEVQLPIGKALKFETKNDMRDGGVVYQISYVVVDGKDAYTLHFTTEESRETIASIADQVAQTWRIAPGK